MAIELGYQLTSEQHVKPVKKDIRHNNKKPKAKPDVKYSKAERKDNADNKARSKKSGLSSEEFQQILNSDPAGATREFKEGINNVLEYWSVDIQGNEETHKLLTGIKMDK